MPVTPVVRHTDALCNLTLRFCALPVPVSVRYLVSVIAHEASTAVDLAEDDVAALLLDVLHFLSGSRYVGHVIWDTPPPDFHALFEAWLCGRWALFDPTRMVPPGNVIRIDCGLDTADCPFATIFGSAQMTRVSSLVFAHAQDRRLAA